MNTFHVYYGPLIGLTDGAIRDINNLNGDVIKKSPQPVIITGLIKQDEIVEVLEKHGFDEIEVHKADKRP